MSKTTTVELTVGEDIRFSQRVWAWLNSGWTFTQETPPFYREVFDAGTPPDDRDYMGTASDEQTLNDFFNEIDFLCASGKCVAIDLTSGAFSGSVTGQQNGTCEFVFFGSQLCLPDEDGKPTRRADWNRIVSAITTPLHERGIFVLWMTLYEDFI